MKLSVTTTPQAIFPDGHQTAFTIANQGPYTVYIDSDSSVGSHSLPLPANGTIVWQAHSPLWVVTRDGDTTLLITRNQHAAHTERAQADNHLLRTQVGEERGGGGVPHAHGMIECTSYNTIYLQVTSPTLWGDPTHNTGQKLYVSWYDDAFTKIGGDVYKFWYGLQTGGFGIGGGVRFTVPVRGAFCVIEHKNYNSAGTDGVTHSVNIDVSGTSRVFPPRIEWVVEQPDNDDDRLEVVNLFPTQDADEFDGDVGHTTNSASISAWQAVSGGSFNTRYLAVLGSRLYIRIRTGPVTTAGTLFVASGHDNGTQLRVFASISVPVAAGTTQIEKDVVVPISEPVRLVWLAQPVLSAGDLNVHLVWED